MPTTETSIPIPREMLPSDGRFGSGPSKVRREAVEALAAHATDYLGTSHRRDTVRNEVGRLRTGLAELFSLPSDWEVVLGNGGTTVFWDAASFALIERRAQHLSFGEFSSKFADVTTAAPHLEDPEVIEAQVGTAPVPVAADVDAYALTHNETSTGVVAPIVRPSGDGLVLVDATSAAGAVAWEPDAVDCYYFAPQKALASDGGLWLAACAPAAIERIERLSGSDRWIPASIDLGTAVKNSRQNQTYNTPGLATIFLAAEMVDWINQSGGLAWSRARSGESSNIVYDWADSHTYATPFVGDRDHRSPVVCTIDFEGVDADEIASVLRANGILDTESYRKLGRNQLRLATFPAIEPDDVRALCRCIDHVISQLV